MPKGETMRFFNRKGDEISEKEWKALYRDKSYSTINRTENETHVVETSWIGVLMPCEEVRRTFVTVVKKISTLNCFSSKKYYWARTEAEALAFHEKCLPKEKALL
jgi:hypothetical protein